MLRHHLTAYYLAYRTELLSSLKLKLLKPYGAHKPIPEEAIRCNMFNRHKESVTFRMLCLCMCGIVRMFFLWGGRGGRCGVAWKHFKERRV